MKTQERPEWTPEQKELSTVQILMVCDAYGVEAQVKGADVFGQRFTGGRWRKLPTNVHALRDWVQSSE